MALPRTQTKTKPRTIQKQKSFKDFFNTGRKKIYAIGGVLVVAAIGAYLMFFVGAAPNNCSPVEGGGVCDVNQASSPDGTDAVVSRDAEVQNLGNSGWTDWGVAFRAPDFPQNGAVPVWRFYNPGITAHFVVLEGSEDYNRIAADPANIREGISFYAWPDGRQPGTVPIYRINRKPLWFLQMYVDNVPSRDFFLGQPDGSYTDGGVNFYAYPGNYYPPVKTTAPTKDTDCANQNITVGDKGACVQWHKGILNGYNVINGGTATPLDTNNNEFDDTTSSYTRVFVTSLKQRGVNVQSYSGIVTKEIWDALAVGYPAAPPPTKPAPGPVKPAPKLPTKPQPKDPGNTDTAPPQPKTPDTKPEKTPAQKCKASGGRYDSRADVCKFPPKKTDPKADCENSGGRWSSDGNVCKYPPAPAPTQPQKTPAQACADRGGRWDANADTCKMPVTELPSAKKLCVIKWKQEGYSIANIGGGEKEARLVAVTRSACDKRLKYEASTPPTYGSKYKKTNLREYWDNKLVDTMSKSTY